MLAVLPLGLAVALMMGGGIALAADPIDEAASAMRQGASVYSDPAAELELLPGEVDKLAAQIAETRLPIFIAVVPESANGSGTVEDSLVRFKDEVGLGGIYAIVSGTQFRAGSTKGSVSDLATEAFREESSGGLFPVLTRFVELTDARFNGTAPDPNQPVAGEDEGGSLIGSLIFWMFFLGIIGLVVFAIVRSRRNSKRQLAQVRTAIDEDVTEFGERVAGLDTSDPKLPEESRADVSTALDAYERAKAAAVGMRSPADAASVTSALEDGRYALACVEARKEGKPLPERRPPCFVDPRHGPSVADVGWTPPGLPERQVPMCADCEAKVERGEDPIVREVEFAGGQRRPYWQAGRHFGGYARGYYSPFGSAMGGALVGTAIGGVVFAPTAVAAEPSGWQASGWASAPDGGDFGGGGSDFGGGGGDFGGGDFGGGGD